MYVQRNITDVQYKPHINNKCFHALRNELWFLDHLLIELANEMAVSGEADDDEPSDGEILDDEAD